MEVELQKALKGKGAVYAGVPEAVVQHLATEAQLHGIATAKDAAAAFDRWMAVNRLGQQSVGPEDVAAWSASYKGRQQLLTARSHNLFNRMSLDDMVLGELGDGAENEGSGGSGGSGQPSARITPYMSKVAARPHTPATGGKFAERQNAGSLVASLNPQLEVPEEAEEAGGAAEAMDVDGGGDGAAAGRPRVEVEVLGAPLGRGATYMVDRLEDRAAYLEARILAAEEAAGGEVHPTGAAAQEPALFVGRIVCDAEGGRLNPQSLLLEGSQRSSGGARVRLDVSKCSSAYRLFPGQVVALRGTNPSGHCVVAAEVLPGHALPLPATPLGALAQHAAATGRRGLGLVAAAGPFTSSEDLEYAPLGALLDYCAQPGRRPDVLLLLGPFVDADHPAIRGGLLEESFEEVYASRVLGQLARFSSAVGGATRIVLVPSTRDVHHHPVLPQPPLEAGGVGGALAAANPATLRCNEVVLGASSADWLMACNREEVSRPAPGQAAEERLPALAAHLPAQRSYYPLFPPPADVPLDCTRGAAALAMPCTPDLLLLPSDLAPFAKLCPVHGLAPQAGGGEEAAGGAGAAAPAAAAVGGTAVCVNPGRLTKGASGGTFAHIHILPLPEAADVAGGVPAATNAPMPHQLERRCKVEIKRV